MIQVIISNKAGLATQKVARILADCEVGQNIPTISALVERCDTARGNIQQALAALKESGAVRLESHGQRGTKLLGIDHLLLARTCGLGNVAGAMPLPYTRRYEGLATALYTALEQTDHPAFIAFMRGSEARIQTLMEGKVDFCVMSRLAYEEHVGNGKKLRLVLDCGPHSYVGQHILLTRPGLERGESWAGRRVGIDPSSADQSLLTRRYFAGEEVELVPVQYTQILPMLLAGGLDAGIWNEDDLAAHVPDIGRLPLEPSGEDLGDTNAVITVRRDDAMLYHLLRQFLRVDGLLETQRQVMAGAIPARY